MSRSLTFISIAVLGALSSTSHAQGLRAVRPIDGYICMDLNRTEAQMFDPAASVVVRESPQPYARTIGVAAATAIVSQEPAVNGYRQVLLFDSKPGWVLARDLKPSRDLSGAGKTCVPSVMSNGRLGITYRGP